MPKFYDTFCEKKELKNKWYLVNAENLVVGRLASYISKILRGKNKSQFNPNQDNGDFVIVTNIERLNLPEKNLKTKFIINTQVILEE